MNDKKLHLLINTFYHGILLIPVLLGIIIVVIMPLISEVNTVYVTRIFIALGLLAGLFILHIISITIIIIISFLKERKKKRNKNKT